MSGMQVIGKFCAGRCMGDAACQACSGHVREEFADRRSAWHMHLWAGVEGQACIGHGRVTLVCYVRYVCELLMCSRSCMQRARACIVCVCVTAVAVRHASGLGAWLVSVCERCGMSGMQHVVCVCVCV